MKRRSITLPNVYPIEFAAGFRVPKKAALFYDSEASAKYGLKILFQALETAGLTNDYRIFLFNLTTVRDRKIERFCADLIVGSTLTVFSVESFRSNEILDWVDSWLPRRHIRSRIARLKRNALTGRDDEPAFLCSYFPKRTSD